MLQEPQSGLVMINSSPSMGSQREGKLETTMCQHSPCHSAHPVSAAPSSSCWQNLSSTFHRRTQRRGTSKSNCPLSPTSPPSSKKSFLREAPDEILEIILLYSVRGHCDLRRLALSCKRWHKFTQEDHPWKRLSVRAWGNRSDIVQVPIKKDSSCAPWREYYISRIQSHLPEINYMIRQQHMTVSIRSILINWLLAVIDEFQPEDEEGLFFTHSHHQTVAILDHYCHKVGGLLQTSDLQMIGAACAVLALHEGTALDHIQHSFFSKASFFTDGACTTEEVVAEAHKIIQTLESPSIPVFETSCEYIDILLTAMQKNYSGSSTYCLAHYLGELSLQAEASLKYSPLLIGTSAYALACHTLGWAETIWMPLIRTHVHIQSLNELRPCMGELQGLLRQALAMLTRRTKKATLPHVVVKYSRRDKQHVAKVIVTDSAWPVVCPHGFDRELEEYCHECEGDDAVNQSVSSNHSSQSLEESLCAESVNSSNGDAETENLDVEEDAVEIMEGGSPAGRSADAAMCTGATPRDFASERGSAHTPVNAPFSGGDAGLLERALTGVAKPRNCNESGVGAGVGGSALQDVSFGAISEGIDNSFNNSTFECTSDDRRQSFGSVLGKVFEEEADERDGHQGSSEDVCPPRKVFEEEDANFDGDCMQEMGGEDANFDTEECECGGRGVDDAGEALLCDISAVERSVNEMEEAVSDISIDSDGEE